MTAFADDPDVHVVVVSGAGGKAFASGADLVEYERSRATPAARADYDEVLDAFWASWDAFDKPTIAMIRGACVGGGLFVALTADIRVAADDSEFAALAAALGVGLVTWGVDAVLTAVGPAYASELLFSARRVVGRGSARDGARQPGGAGSGARTTAFGLAAQIVATARAST